MRKKLFFVASVIIRPLVMLLTFAAVPMAQAAQQENTGNESTQSYPFAYFEQFNPQTALDMIERMPGFRMNQGAELRGFGDSAGNVLVNGDRPSSKSGGIEDALKIISATSVLRIDLIRGAVSSSEAEGQALVANVITLNNSTNTFLLAQIENTDHGKINSLGQLVFSNKILDWETSTRLSASIERQPLSGSRITSDALNSVLLIELENSPSDVRNFLISSAASRSIKENSFNLNFRLSDFELYIPTKRLGFSGADLKGVPVQRHRIDSTLSRRNVELGADWSRTVLKDWTAKVVTLGSLQESSRETLSLIVDFAENRQSISNFTNYQEKYETVIRGILEKRGTQTLLPGFSAEVSYNRLDSELLLNVDDADGARNIILPTAIISVEEIRAQLVADLTWKATNKLTIESGLGVEYSKISVSGDAKNAQSFYFAKPYLSLNQEIRPGLQFSFRARHSIGQLSFTDFSASASATDDRFLDGNPNLGPDRKTRVSSVLDWRSSNTGGAINFEIFHEWRYDVLEQIVLPSGIPGLSNVGSARVWGLKSAISIPLDKFIEGGLLDVEAEFRDSTFYDPIISKDRSLSNINDADVLIEFRQDIEEKQISWGVSYRAPLEGPYFFADEISLNRDSASWNAFIETTRFNAIKISFELSGIGSQNFSRNRILFSPDRSEELIGRQLISRDQGMFATLTISGNLP